jgi:hypothetical protein
LFGLPSHPGYFVAGIEEYNISPEVAVRLQACEQDQELLQRRQDRQFVDAPMGYAFL